MKGKIIYIFWGIVFILAGGGVLLGYIDFEHFTQQVRLGVFASASAAFILTYLLDGVRKWGWLFPALICAAVGWNSLRIGRPFDLLNPDWTILAALAIPLYIGFALNRKRWGLLIPAYILSVPALIEFSSEMIAGIYQGTGLYPTIPLIVAQGVGQMLLLALPFFTIYFWSKKNWWALMPAGGFVSVELVNTLQIMIPNNQNALTGVFSATLLLGLAATMGVLWLRRATQPTGWAIYPAAGLLVLAVAAFILGKGWVDLSQDFKAIVFAAGSAAFLLAYSLHGVKKWGWLFPAFASAAIALTIWMETRAMDGSIMAAPLFAGLALPFFVGFAVDRNRRGLLIPAALLSAFSIFLLIADTVHEEWTGVTFLFLMSMPFFVTYFLSKRNWWAIIPAGVMASLGLVAGLETFIPHAEYASLPNTLSIGVYIWVLFLGLAATFGVLWLRRRTQPTGWAGYPAAGLLAIAILSFILGERFQVIWPGTVMLVIGAMFLLTLVIKKIPAAQQATEVKA